MPRSERPAMADYGVPADLDGVLPWAWAAERLVRCRNYWLVSVSAAGRPHALPVWGVWIDAEDWFAFSCAASARKARNLAANPQVVVGIDDTVECVSVEGRARFATATETDRAIAAYLAKYEPDPAKHDAMQTFLRSNPFYVVEPERAFGVIEREDEFAARATRWVW